MSIDFSMEALNIFCTTCEKDLQKAVFNNKFLRYNKSLCDSLFLCVLCLVESSMDQGLPSLRVGKWDARASKFSNIFVALSRLEIRKHRDKQHTQSSSLFDIVDLSNRINSVSWKEASLLWDEKHSEKHSVLKKHEKAKKKQLKDLSEWSVKEFGADYTVPIITKCEDRNLIDLNSNIMVCNSTPQGIAPLTRRLTALERSMDHETFITHAYKDIKMNSDVTPTDSMLISKMSLDDFISYSSRRRRRKSSHVHHSIDARLFKNNSQINFDDLEDFSDHVTYNVDQKVVSDFQFIEHNFEHEIQECGLNNISSGSEKVDLCLLVEANEKQIVRADDNFSNIRSLPDLCDCPLDPHYIDTREEWGVQPRKFIYSPPIITSQTAIHDQNDNEVQLSLLRNSNIHFKEYIIGSKHKSYQEMVGAIRKVLEDKTLDISLCQSKIQRRTLLQGILPIFICVASYFMIR
jgi:hypothetical protein